MVQQPEGQRSAVVGGIHMQNLRRLGVRALVVDGRIRDRREIAGLDMPVGSERFPLFWRIFLAIFFFFGFVGQIACDLR